MKIGPLQGKILGAVIYAMDAKETKTGQKSPHCQVE